MKKQIDLVRKFHQKFHVPIANKPTLIDDKDSSLRYELMKEEVREYLGGVQDQDLENVSKELADILYTVYGTILTHGLQDKIEEIFEEVHLSNMSKDFHPIKATKGDSYFEADIKKILS